MYKTCRKCLLFNWAQKILITSKITLFWIIRFLLRRSKHFMLSSITRSSQNNEKKPMKISLPIGNNDVALFNFNGQIQGKIRWNSIISMTHFHFTTTLLLMQEASRSTCADFIVYHKGDALTALTPKDDWTWSVMIRLIDNEKMEALWITYILLSYLFYNISFNGSLWSNRRKYTCTSYGASREVMQSWCDIKGIRLRKESMLLWKCYSFWDFYEWICSSRMLRGLRNFT